MLGKRWGIEVSNLLSHQQKAPGIIPRKGRALAFWVSSGLLAVPGPEVLGSLWNDTLKLELLKEPPGLPGCRPPGETMVAFRSWHLSRLDWTIQERGRLRSAISFHLGGYKTR